MNNALVFDPELLQRYDLSGPRYTSYPTAVQFHEGFDEGAYRTAVAASNNAARPLSLYLHLPFCGTVCYYCACNKIITANRKRAAPYLNDLHREIELQAAVLTPGREVRQLHWGGGTPTFISDEEMRALMAQLRRNFRFLDNDEGDYSIEIDPREVDPAKIGLLRELGFNRMSFGVQDFDPKVQEAVNRIQTVEETFAAVNARAPIAAVDVHALQERRRVRGVVRAVEGGSRRPSRGRSGAGRRPSGSSVARRAARGRATAGCSPDRGG